jgi:lysophospholipase L1-like esterase
LRSEERTGRAIAIPLGWYGHDTMDGWVTTWGAALQPPDQADDPSLDGAWMRQTIRVTVGGRRARLVLSNEYGERPLELAATVSLPLDGQAGASIEEPGSREWLTFDGSPSVTIPPGARATSDPFSYVIEPRTNLTVTLSVRSAPSMLTTHPGSRTTSHVLHVPGGLEAWARAIPVAHWYFLAALEVQPDETGAAVVCLGDSLTDGRSSTTNGNDRWPDVLADRLHAQGLTGLAVVNQAAGGNRVLRDGLGIAALHRLERDVLAAAGARWLILFEGVNDIGTAEATDPQQRRIGDELVAGYLQIIDRARSAGLRVCGATLTPFGGHEYDDPAGVREQTRQRVNAWIRQSGRFDAVIDFDRAVRGESDQPRVRGELHDGDFLHLNPAGYRVLAGAVPTELFR